MSRAGTINLIITDTIWRPSSMNDGDISIFVDHAKDLNNHEPPAWTYDSKKSQWMRLNWSTAYVAYQLLINQYRYNLPDYCFD